MSRSRLLSSLLVPLLLGLAAASPAQSAEQYAVIYVEFLPHEANHGKKLVDDLARQSVNSPHVINFSAVRETARPNRFALVGRWDSHDGFLAYKASSTWTSFVSSATPLLGAPLDERDGILLQ